MSLDQPNRVNAESILGEQGITTTYCDVTQWNTNVGQVIQTTTYRWHTQDGQIVGNFYDDDYSNYVTSNYNGGGSPCLNTPVINGYYYEAQFNRSDTTNTGAYEVFDMVTVAAMAGVFLVILAVCWIVAKKWFTWNAQEVTEDDNYVWYENKGKMYFRPKTAAEKRMEV